MYGVLAKYTIPEKKELNLKTTYRVTRAASRNVLSAIVLFVIAAPAAWSQMTMSGGYIEMCKQSTLMPQPYGEWDLKGNPKLDEYCGCFATAFAVRAAAAMKAREGGAKPPPLAQSRKEELDLRNVCREKSGLPPAVKKSR